MIKHIKKVGLNAVVVFLTLLTLSANAQQEAQFSQYMNNNLLINPGVTGMEQFLNLNIGYRNQWNGLDGALNTYYITGHKRLGIKESSVGHSLPVRGANPQLQTEISNSFDVNKVSPHGVGAYMFLDDQGIATQTGAGVNYAYHMLIGSNNFSFGFSGGILQYSLNGDQLNPIDPSDNSVMAEKMSSLTGDFSAGLWLSNKSYYAGIALNQLLQSGFDLQSTGSATNKQYNHYNITGGYKLDLGNSLLLMPSVLIKYVSPAPVTIDFNAIVSMNNKYSLGLSYRNSDAIVILAGARFNSLQFNYSYDVNTSDLSSYNNGTHELMLGLGLGSGANNGKTLHW